MLLERAKQLLALSDQSGNPYLSPQIKSIQTETIEERLEVLNVWKTKPGFYTYNDTLREMIRDMEVKNALSVR